MKRIWISITLLSLPLLVTGLGILIAMLMGIDDARVVLRARLDLLIISLGLLIWLVLAIVLISRYRRDQQKQRDQKTYQRTSQQEHQRFIQRLDHELKNPLTAIQLGLENIESSVADKALISTVKAQAQRLNQLTNDLRKLAAFDDQDLALEIVDMSELLQLTKELASEHPQAGLRNIHITLPTAWPLANVHGDNDLLQLAFYNLLENAIKYSDPGDEIDIRASDNGTIVTVEISDTGLGIAASEVAQVCDELFRGYNGRDRAGTGIGLSLVKKIIERHHGNLSISSKETQGTRIIVTLPVH